MKKPARNTRPKNETRRAPPEYQPVTNPEREEFTGEDGRRAQPQVLGANEARQAVSGHGVHYVLFFGLLGVVIAFILIYLYF